MNRSSDIFTGLILLKTKIAAHTYHIRIQSMELQQLGTSISLTAEIFLSHPCYFNKRRTFHSSFWNYEPVYHTVDLAINTRTKDDVAEWMGRVQEGDTVFFKVISEEPVPDESGDSYFLIGGNTALSRLYEINRTLAVSKNISSLIYAEQEEDLFPDLDHSFPLNFCISLPVTKHKIKECIRSNFPQHTNNTVVYLLGNQEINSFVSEYIRTDFTFERLNIYLKNFDE